MSYTLTAASVQRVERLLVQMCSPDIHIFPSHDPTRESYLLRQGLRALTTQQHLFPELLKALLHGYKISSNPNSIIATPRTPFRTSKDEEWTVFDSITSVIDAIVTVQHHTQTNSFSFPALEATDDNYSRIAAWASRYKHGAEVAELIGVDKPFIRISRGQ